MPVLQDMSDPDPPPSTSKAETLQSDWTRSDHSQVPPPAAEAPAITPGTMLAGRYRVVAPLGRGGMGEVYRADDTKLGQPVALKFVRGTLSPALLERLYSEVRIGRQVSHPNVCRLYDVVEVEGQTFLAMEYVDGEDLASLLARIGRLPGDKALDIARDLCAGLAAMHDKGIVHRDLKPGNVMIDGRGRARLTDFGLAVALEAPGTYTYAGTPAYMSPEQLAGGPLTPKADLYALGLLLYEMVSGSRFFEARTLEELHTQHREAKAPRLVSVGRALDPRTERVILRCLEENPEHRPGSARALLALLPGGDPLEAALAAGETPSPEAVAASVKVGDLSPAMAWAGLAVVLAGLAFTAWLFDQGKLFNRTLLPRPTALLVERARETLARFGQTAAADHAYAFVWDKALFAYVESHDRSFDRWEKLARAALPPVYFFYRQSPLRLVAENRDGQVRRDDPPRDQPGMAEVVLDPSGRLLSFGAVPPRVEPSGSWPEPDWRPLFEQAGLDPASFRAVEPQWTAPTDSDRKAAWEGSYPGEPDVPVRIEGAAYHGRPVWFAVLPPWATVEAQTVPSPTPVGTLSVMLLAIAMPLGGVLLARRNIRLGRGDRKGAFRVALFVFVAYATARLFRADHVASFGQELWILIKVFAYPCFWAAQVWLLYMALEPFARRRWPHVLISWKRLLGGSLRDPLVGRDVLLGAAGGVLLLLTFIAGAVLPLIWGEPPNSPGSLLDGSVLSSLRQAMFRVFVNQYSAVLFGMVFLFILALLRMLVRKAWLAAILWCLVMSTPNGFEHPILGAIRAFVMLGLLLRGGLLPLVVALYVVYSALEVPITLDVSAWFAAQAFPVIGAIVALAVYGFYTSLGGKPLFGGALLED
jgi:serine/threonine-protein kinase